MSSVEITSAPDKVEAKEAANFNFEVTISDITGQNADVDLTAVLFVNGTNEQAIVASTSTTATENDIVQGTLTHSFQTNSSINENLDDLGKPLQPESSPFEDDADTGDNNRFNSYPRTDEPVFIQVELDYYGVSGYAQGTVDQTITTSKLSVEILQPTGPEPELRAFGDEGPEAGENTLGRTFEGRTPFSIQALEFEEDASYITSVFNEETDLGEEGFVISFDDYPNPTVSIDTAGRFAKHEIIGGSTVRQKIGEDPVNVSINGVCKRRTANQIDSLRDAKHGKIYSDRLPGSNDSLRVQFGSTNTEPMTDGGAADLKDGQYLYTYQINCIEVIR